MTPFYFHWCPLVKDTNGGQGGHGEFGGGEGGHGGSCRREDVGS